MVKDKWPWAAVQAYRRHKDCIRHLISERDYWFRMYTRQTQQLKWMRVRWAVFGILWGAAAMRWWPV